MATTDSRRLGPFLVAPMGFGAMRLTGPNVFGPPPDRHAALEILRFAVQNGVNHVDTAQFYGPDVVNELIREALSPYPDDLVIVSKVGAARDAQGGIHPADRPEQLRLGIEDNLRTLGRNQLAAVNLRVMRSGEPDGFFDDQLHAMIQARDDGLIGAVGLSNVSIAQLTYAAARVDIACVQNAYHPAQSEARQMVAACDRLGVASVPFLPLSMGGWGRTLVSELTGVRHVAARHDATPTQVGLAWALATSPRVLLIPGTSDRRHLEENLAAVGVELAAEELRELEIDAAS